MEARTGFAIALSIVYLGGASVFAFGTFLIRVFACYENCDASVGRLWRDDPGAWQWNAILVLGVATLILASAAIWFALIGRRGIGLVAFFAGAAAALAAVALVGESHTGSDSGFLTLVVLGLLVGLAALALFPGPPRLAETA